MSTDRPFLLVIDPSPENAAQVNSQLRNSGINVHVLHANRLAEADRLAREFKPFLIYYTTDSHAIFPVVQAASLAQQYQIFMAMWPDPQHNGIFLEALRTTPCLAVNSDEQLVSLVRRLSKLSINLDQASAQRAQEQELEGRLNLLMESTKDPIAYFHEGLHVAANSAYLELLGVSKLDDLEMASLLDIASHASLPMKEIIRGFGNDRFPDAQEIFELRRLDETAAPARRVNLEFASVRYDGEDCVQMRVTPLENTASAASSTRQADQPTEAMNQSAQAPLPPARPETHLTPEQSAAPANEDADPLTGMLWRRPFMNRLSQRLECIPPEHRGALFYLRTDDADKFMQNATTTEMDNYVTSTANEILTSVDDQDTVGRFDDSTYLVFATRSAAAELKRLGEKLCSSIEQLGIRHPEGDVPDSCSIGMVLLDLQDHNNEHTFSNARSAWKLAAAEGNRMIRFKPARMAGVSDDEEAEWIARLRYALDNDDFYTVQRAVMSLEGDGEGIFENRTFLHEDQAEIPTAEFLPPAERNQLASQVDRHVIPGLLRAVAEGKERHLIPISGNSLQDFSFSSWFQRQLQEHGVDGNRIILQWPAWAGQQQDKATRRLISELSGNGCQFAVYDFYQDPKLIASLKDLHLQYLTLSTRLTTDLQSNRHNVDIIRNIVHAAEAENTHALATDIPNSGDLAVLWQCGVKLVSGDFLQEESRVIGQ